MSWKQRVLCHRRINAQMFARHIGRSVHQLKIYYLPAWLPLSLQWVPLWFIAWYFLLKCFFLLPHIPTYYFINVTRLEYWQQWLSLITLHFIQSNKYIWEKVLSSFLRPHFPLAIFLLHNSLTHHACGGLQWYFLFTQINLLHAQLLFSPFTFSSLRSRSNIYIWIYCVTLFFTGR